MKKEAVTAADQELVAAAIKAVKAVVARPLGEARAPAYVAAAIRLSDGSIETAVNLIADVGGLSTCAEPIAISKTIHRADVTIETIVAVHHEPGYAPRIVSPCGRCREAITDYAGHCHVILREPKTEEIFRVKAQDLLPFKYAVYWDGDIPL